MGRDAPPLDGQQRFSPYKQENAIFRIGKTGGKYYMENMAEAANYRNPLIRGKVGDRRKWGQALSGTVNILILVSFSEGITRELELLTSGSWTDCTF